MNKLNEDSDSNESENDDQNEDKQKENETPITSTSNLGEVNENEPESSPVKNSITKKDNKKTTNPKNQETNETNETESIASKSMKCSVCDEEFDTRNKLFEHIKKEGHAALKTVDANEKPLSHNAMKKNKRMANKAAKNK
jgi:DnaJ family protein A protein 5